MSNEDEFFTEMHPQIAQIIGMAVMQLLVEKREPSREALIEMIQVLWQGGQVDLAVELALDVPLLASLAVRRQLALRYGVDCQIKWPNDLLLNGKKIVGILCESVCYGYQQQGRGILCGIGINLAQPQSYFDAADLPHGTSLALQGATIDLEQDPGWLAEALTDFGFDRPLYTFARDGFAPFREEYKAACVNIGRRVTFDLPDGGQGAGEAVDVDEEGRLVVRTDSGEEHVFTGEVSVRGIYGSL